ncbi:hypothetical protein [Aquimarina algiphila]|uniref:hypothetical protein n=1 Tax=Aquimarina algiphila TaxID=2047982 RepID=UPI00232C6608|nr:hypothetical protein [Aquimarina algiphila]
MKNKAPSRLYYDFGTLFTATKSFIDHHNQNKPRLKDRLNANHRATAELITRLYAKQLNKVITKGTDIKEGLPGFKTFNPSLATCKGCTVRTIINHKERLKAAGFIIKETHHGKTGIELWINPSIFTPPKLSTPNMNPSLKITQLASFFDERVKNLHPLVHEHQEQKNNNSIVNCLKTSKEEKGIRLPAHDKTITAVTRTLQEQDKNIEESRTSDSKKQTRGVKNLLSEESEPAFLLQLVRDFWQYARTKLFANEIFAEAEETEILNNIWRSVYRKFRVKGSKEDWRGYQQTLYTRVDMVARWLERNPNRWVAPPHLYFSPENKRNGFKKTYRWFLKQQTLKREIRNRILIQNTEKEWTTHSKGEGKHKHKTRLQLFRLQQQRLEYYGDEALIRAYEKSLHNMVNT